MTRRRSVKLPYHNPRGTPLGQRICVWCGKGLTGRKIDWCSRRCVLTYQIARGDQGAARSWLRFGPEELDRQPRAYPIMRCALCDLDVSDEAIERRAAELVTEVGRKAHAHSRRQLAWEADHIVPLVEGGAAHPSNLRILCRPCHLSETRKLRGRMAERRRAVNAVGEQG